MSGNARESDGEVIVSIWYPPPPSSPLGATQDPRSRRGGLDRLSDRLRLGAVAIPLADALIHRPTKVDVYLLPVNLPLEPDLHGATTG